MGEAIIAGVGMTTFGKHSDSKVRALAKEAAQAAIKDAGVEDSQIQALFFGNAAAGMLVGQEMIRGQVFLQDLGFKNIPVYNLENACASASTALHLACMSVAAGQYDLVIAVGAEKLTHEDKSMSFRAIGSAVDMEWAKEMMKMMGMDKPEKKEEKSSSGEKKEGHSRFMDIYAIAAQAYMHASGATARDFAMVAEKNRFHASLNPYAQFRDIVTVDDVLESRLISKPLTLLMCSPIGDGAASAVVCSPEKARQLGINKQVFVAGSELRSGMGWDGSGDDTVEQASQAAYEKAGIGPSDLNIVELHDAAAPAELIVYEELGLCEKGGGPELIRSGATRLGGRVPVNTSGGLLSKGHPIGATGLAQIVELVWQLRGEAGERQVEGAKIALSENAGGFIGLGPAAGCIHILKV